MISDAEYVTPLRGAYVTAVELDGAGVRAALRDFDALPRVFVRRFGDWTAREWERIVTIRARARRLEQERRTR